MIARGALIAWFALVPPVADWSGAPLRRPKGEAEILATVALEHPEVDPRVIMATLDVLAARESGYRHDAAGDCPGLPPGSRACTREKGARSFGAFQTPIAITPADPLGQARLAARILVRSIEACPTHPLWAYASGVCRPSHVARLYEQLVADEVAVPLPEVAQR